MGMYKTSSYDEVKGRRDFKELGGLTEADYLYLKTLTLKDGQPDVRRQRVWFARCYGPHGGRFGWEFYQGLVPLDPPEGAEVTPPPTKKKNQYEPYERVVECTRCGVGPMRHCVSAKGGWTPPHAARRRLARQRYPEQFATD